jgi:hypothetical protein
LVNVTYLVADADLAEGDLLIGLPVLQHLGADTKTLLDRNRDVFDGVDCTGIGKNDDVGTVGRLMTLRLNKLPAPQNSAVILDENRPRINYYDVRQEEDPFPDSSLLDPMDSAQQDDIKEAADDMINQAIDNGLPLQHQPALRKTVLDHMDIFRKTFSSGPPAKVSPLKIDLLPHASPVRVRLRKYSQEQRKFLSSMVAQLVDCGMAYANPTSP